MPDRPVSKVVVMMERSEQTERIRALVESFESDRAERERLKQKADESLERLHRAVAEFREASAEHKAAPAANSGN
jgi:hypothetical protein